MGKIRSLTEDEAGHLRSSLLKAFRERFGRVFIPVTYLGAYEDLREMILSVLSGEPDAASSVSLHRLRKLFYYTDPSFCPSGQLETFSFGDDFISLLEKFCQEKTTMTKEEAVIKPMAHLPVWGSRRMVYLVSTILIVLLTYLSYRFYPRPHYSFRDDFQFNSVEELKKRGWDFIDFDSSLFYPQDTGVLTLRSSRGDYWVRPGDTPYILNAVYRELPKGCFEVTTKFTFPNSLERYQQCGIVLLDLQKTRNHNIRITYAQSDGPRGYQIIKRFRGEATQQWHEEISRDDTTDYNIFFKIHHLRNEYSFFAHLNEEDAAFYSVGNMTFDFIPVYVVLVAFNGYRNSADGPLNTAGSIPAKFDWVRVEGCE